MIKNNKILKIDPFSLKIKNKEKIFLDIQKKLLKHHLKKCPEYKNLLKGFSLKKIRSAEELPFLSIKLFKEISLTSISRKDQFKILSSSGTSGKKSSIYLDKNTAHLQQLSLIEISKDFLGNQRYPMIILDNEKILYDRTSFSAKAAAIRGFSIFAKEKCFILDENQKLNFTKLNNFLKKYKNKKILIFGFTFQIWKEIITKNNFKISNKCIVLHGGGWKKMQNLSIDNIKFNRILSKKINTDKIINYYGMVEQVGSVFMECEKGYFHCSNFSDIFIRNEKLELLENKKIGIVQMLSLLPWSYPGQNILTEDLGIIQGVDDCKCGRSGKYFKIIGRIPNSEIRGCSDTGIS